MSCQLPDSGEGNRSARASGVVASATRLFTAKPAPRINVKANVEADTKVRVRPQRMVKMAAPAGDEWKGY
jgi:hypothetical protein